ncbi:hypothetical protein CKAN_02769500 [Cinnamomum micranthum f. kanehirae]|uniref:Uncharacterized protein n=1 Tax=Cinnamomum micranthum f. kanehirae TaxID=337451 RepID=A0A3S3PCJ0_9MAGN|nr:hypothetical protein CKAN_02769500 [Cinnamomum micranthum f. kanehirae]
MPSTRALLATNHSLAGRSGSAFQVRYPNRLLCSTGSLAPSSILSTALLLGSLLLQPLAVVLPSLRDRKTPVESKALQTTGDRFSPSPTYFSEAGTRKSRPKKAVSREALTLAWFHTHETRRRYGTTSSLRKANSILYPIVVFFVR